MKALTWHGKRDVRVDDVPDPVLQDPTDAIIEVTSTAICGSDLHLYEVLGPYMHPGDVLGHETMGSCGRSGPRSPTSRRRPRRRPVQHLVRFMLDVQPGAVAQCETTQNRRPATARRCSATPSCTARCRAGRRSTCGCRRRDFGPIKVRLRAARRALPLPLRHPADRLAGGEVRRRARGGTLAVLGLGPVGQLAARIGKHLGAARVDRRRLGARSGRAMAGGTASRPWTAARSTTSPPR